MYAQASPPKQQRSNHDLQQRSHDQRACCDHQYTDRCNERVSPPARFAAHLSGWTHRLRPQRFALPRAPSIPKSQSLTHTTQLPSSPNEAPTCHLLLLDLLPGTKNRLLKTLLLVQHDTSKLDKVNTVIIQNYRLNSRGATCPPPHHQHTAHPSLDTSPTVVQFLPIPPSTALRLPHSDFPVCASHF